MNLQQSQARLWAIEKEIKPLADRLNVLMTRLEDCQNEHRDLIRESLKSPDVEERELAQRLCAFWQVTKES